MTKYKTFIMKMSQDNPSIAHARLNLDLLCDIHTLLTLSCLMLLLKIINVLIKFAYERDVFICDFVPTIKICQIDFVMMYFDLMTNYQREHFQVFCDVVDNSSTTITQDWVINLNTSAKTLHFAWLIIHFKLTFSIQLLGLINQCVRMFSWHPLNK